MSQDLTSFPACIFRFEVQWPPLNVDLLFANYARTTKYSEKRVCQIDSDNAYKSNGVYWSRNF